MRRSAALAVCLAVLLAGCGGLGSESHETTVTPAPVPEPTPAIPGTSGDRIDPSTVADAHRTALSRTSYTLRSERRVIGPEGQTYLESVQVRRVAAGGHRYAGRFTGRTSNHPVYANGSVSATYWINETTVAIDYAESQPEVRRRAGDGPVSDLTAANATEDLLRWTEASVVDRTASGDAVVAGTMVESGTGIRRGLYVTNVTNVRFRAVVTPAGVVREWRARYDAELRWQGDGRIPVTVVRSLVVTEVGSTTVERPAWVDNATRADG